MSWLRRQRRSLTLRLSNNAGSASEPAYLDAAFLTCAKDVRRPSGRCVFRFPNTSLAEGKTRPALLLAKVPNDFDDWLLCMISSQLHQELSGLDEIVSEADTDFLLSV